jgi:RNA polymerase sigma factor for flagellar operon FliA
LEEKNKSIDAIWKKYKEEGAQEAREKLILQYAPLVKYVASRISAGLPANVEHADLVSYGIFGLIDAIEKFDPARNIKFETYAIARIRGAIVDELRALDWMPRSLRTKSKEIERAYAKLERELARTPTDEDLAKELGVTIDELDKLLAKLSYGSVIALDDLWSSKGENSFEISLMDMVEDPRENNPGVIVEFNDLKEQIAKAIDFLPYKEKTVIMLYYYEGLTLREIGEVLDITESRASQLHTKAILWLKGRLQHLRSQTHELVE